MGGIAPLNYTRQRHSPPTSSQWEGEVTPGARYPAPVMKGTLIRGHKAPGEELLPPNPLGGAQRNLGEGVSGLHRALTCAGQFPYMGRAVLKGRTAVISPFQ